MDAFLCGSRDVLAAERARFANCGDGRRIDRGRRGSWRFALFFSHRTGAPASSRFSPGKAGHRVALNAVRRHDVRAATAQYSCWLRPRESVRAEVAPICRCWRIEDLRKDGAGLNELHAALRPRLLVGSLATPVVIELLEPFAVMFEYAKETLNDNHVSRRGAAPCCLNGTTAGGPPPIEKSRPGPSIFGVGVRPWSSVNLKCPEDVGPRSVPIFSSKLVSIALVIFLLR